MSIGRWFLAAIAAGVVVVSGADGQGAISSPPLYQALKSFCIATHANPAEATDAITHAGGSLQGTGLDNEHPPEHTLSSSWQVVVGGHHLIVYLSVEDITGPKFRNTHSETCGVTSFDDERASIPLIRKWVGVAPNLDDKDNKSGLTQVWFAYEETSGTHTPLSNSDDDLKAQEADGAWQLMLQYDARSARASLTRITAASKPVN